MQPKTLVVMFLVMVSLGAFIFFYEKDLPTTDERREFEKKVLGVEKDDVEALAIAWGGQEVRLERQDSPAGDDRESEEGLEAFAPQATWRLVQPIEARADAAQVDRLLTSLTELEHQRVLEEIDREDAGLDNPEVQVTLTSAKGETELRFGVELPASSDRIAGVSGRGGAYVVASTVMSELQKEPGAWRDKKLFTGTRNDIDRVTLEQAGERLVLARRGDEFWVESPFVDQADEERVNTLITAITGLTVTTFLDQPLLDPSALGLEPAAAVLEVLRPGAEKSFRLELGAATGATDGAHYGRAEGELFELAAGLEEPFGAAPGDWRSRSWASLQVFQVNSATFTDAIDSTTIRREDAEWLRGEDKIEYSTASDLLYAVADTKAERALDATGTLNAPDLTVVLASDDREETLYLYDVDAGAEGGAMASREGREAILAMPREAVDEIRSKLEAVRAAEVLVEEAEGEGAEEEGD